MLWDDTNLYLFYECEDTSLTSRETNFDGCTCIDDCGEFFVAPVPDKVYMHFGLLEFTEPQSTPGRCKVRKDKSLYFSSLCKSYKIFAVNGLLKMDIIRKFYINWSMNFGLINIFDNHISDYLNHEKAYPQFFVFMLDCTGRMHQPGQRG